jgi:hypothetical protein
VSVANVIQKDLGIAFVASCTQGQYLPIRVSGQGDLEHSDLVLTNRTSMALVGQEEWLAALSSHTPQALRKQP